MASTVYPVALSHFAVFCPALGPDEDNTHEQLLFYAAAALPPFYPYSANDYYARTTHLRRRSSGSSSSAVIATPTATPASTTVTKPLGPTAGKGSGGGERVVSLDMKLREIGLAAALVTFANSFGTGKNNFHVVHSEKRRTVVFEPEPGVLMQLSVVLPRRVRPYGKEKDAYSIEFLDSEVSDEALRAWVESEYWAFHLLFGPLQRALAGEQQTVRRQLDAFFGRTLWHWDRRWAASELDLIYALRPLPQMPLGSISLGGFEQLWRDLGELASKDGAEPLVAMTVVLWRGKEILWSSSLLDNSTDDRIHVLRALVTWSRAVFAPTFSTPVRPTSGRKTRVAGQSRAQYSNRAISFSNSSRPASGTSSASSSMPATRTLLAHQQQQLQRQPPQATSGAGSWLWGWRSKPETGPPKQPVNNNESVDTDSDDESGSSGRSSVNTGVQATANIVTGGISQALSRAVNALIEPRPPTPPEVDPVFASEAQADGPLSPPIQPQSLTTHAGASSAKQYAISVSDIDDLAGGGNSSRYGRSWSNAPFAGGGDSDAESLRSIASIQTTRTAATVAVSRQSATARLDPELSTASEGRRTRSTTMQNNVAPPYAGGNSYWPMAIGHGLAHRAHGRSPSIMSNVSAATVESTQLRDDTRVSARSWWPSVLGGSWGAAKLPETVLEQTTTAIVEDDLADPSLVFPPPQSGIDVSTTFLYTGEYPFPGLPAHSSQPQRSREAEHIRVAAADDDNDDSDIGEREEEAADSLIGSSTGGQRQETISRLERAMDEGMPAAYEHGVDIDCERGVALAPRGLSGMQYDSRLLKLMYQGGGDTANTHNSASAAVPVAAATPSASAPERALFTSPDWQDGASKTLVYKYGDLLLVLLGPPTCTPSAQAPAAVGVRGARRRRKRVGEQLLVQRPDVVTRFSGDEALMIEGVVLRYAASLQAAAARDASEVQAQRRSETQLALHRRIPPYLFQERRQRLTRTNWRHEDAGSVVALNRSYAGFYRTSALESGDPRGGPSAPGVNNGNRDGAGCDEEVNPAPLPANVRRTLSVVNAEIANNRGRTLAVCVRMQDKGWVAAASSLSHDGGGSECYCVVDQPKATLADAQTFLTKLSRRAASSVT
ncbi:hypothetical protein GGI19_003167 [Coemansia pectinata]|uniref:CCZ1/INTU/HSP4 first Longin domain-containing protein n=1 Tax=Coemansia pectinata TaxID=1052879 RepID=A0A9W8H089_9FUNG|nr:hypothetical protein GGI19_003167 [Coemansia pectinata]